jgi:hypothetical protein
MKRIPFFVLAFILINLAWMGFIREPLPPIPEITKPISEKVNMKFSINSMNYSGLELALNEQTGGKGMYVQFKMANAWKTGRVGLVVAGIKTRSDFKNGMSPKKYLNDTNRKVKEGKDFSNFMKDNRGNSIHLYSLQHTLVEGKSGKNYMQMSYNGPSMEMLQTIQITRPVTVPAHISRKFIAKGIIQFQPGTVAFDNKIKGFNIPVVIR